MNRHKAGHSRRRPRPAAPGRSRARRRGPRPYVVVNMAITADGKIATGNRAVSAFGSRRDHDHLLELRATADAVLCGARTAAGKGITLGPGPGRYRRQRLRRGLAEFNLRVIASGSAGVDPRSHVFRQRRGPIVVLTTRAAAPARVNRLRSVADAVVAFGSDELDLAGALCWLRRRWNVKRLICEGGGVLNDAMFRAGLVDEVHLTVCPGIVGGRRAPTVADGFGFARLAASTALRLRSRRRVGREMFLVYEVTRGVPPSGSDSAARAISQSKSDNRLK